MRMSPSHTPAESSKWALKGQVANLCPLLHCKVLCHQTRHIGTLQAKNAPDPSFEHIKDWNCCQTNSLSNLETINFAAAGTILKWTFLSKTWKWIEWTRSKRRRLLLFAGTLFWLEPTLLCEARFKNETHLATNVLKKCKCSNLHQSIFSSLKSWMFKLFENGHQWSLSADKVVDKSPTPVSPRHT